MSGRAAIAAILVLLPSTAAAQIPERFDNLQVLPRDIARPQLVQRMREFAFALGVRCEHCHADAAPGVANRYASDVRPAKQKARVMLRMVATINTSLLPALPSHASPPVAVSCVTCHRGLPLPKTLQTTLFEVALERGGEAAVARYRELRGSEMGTGRYDFGEWEINELARRLTEAGRADAAMNVLEMNAEFYPRSAEIQILLGDLHRRRGESDQALARYRAALALAPDHTGAQGRIREIEGKK